MRAGELLAAPWRRCPCASSSASRASAGSRDDEPTGVLLGGDDDQGAAVELAGRLGAVEEAPQPGDRGLRVAVIAVVVAQPAAAAVLARLGDVGAQLLDHEADAAGRDPGDPLAGLGVRRAVVIGAQQRVDEERVRRRCRPGRRWRGCGRARGRGRGWRRAPDRSARAAARRARAWPRSPGRPAVLPARAVFFSLAAAAALASSSSWVRLIALLTSSRYSGRSTMIGRPRSNSISTPAARAWSTSSSVKRTGGGP